MILILLFDENDDDDDDDEKTQVFEINFLKLILLLVEKRNLT